MWNFLESTLAWKIFREISNLSLNALIRRNFCEKVVRVNFYNFHTVFVLTYLKNRLLCGIFDALTPNSQTILSIHRSESSADMYLDNWWSMASCNSSNEPNFSSKCDALPNDRPLLNEKIKIWCLCLFWFRLIYKINRVIICNKFSWRMKYFWRFSWFFVDFTLMILRRIKTNLSFSNYKQKKPKV